MRAYFLKAQNKDLPILLGNSPEEAIALLFTNYPRFFADAEKNESNRIYIVGTVLSGEDQELKMIALKAEAEENNLFYKSKHQSKNDLEKHLGARVNNKDSDSFRKFVKDHSEFDINLYSPYSNSFAEDELEIVENDMVLVVKKKAIWDIANAIYLLGFNNKTEAGLPLEQLTLNLQGVAFNDKSLIYNEIENPNKVEVKIDEAEFQIKGWRNYANSCFLDSTLAAMFLVPNSPLYKTFISETPDRLSQNWDFDVEEMVDNLRSAIDSAESGSTETCRPFRELFAKYLPDQDFVGGQNDPSEFYATFCQVTGYYPIKYQMINMGKMSVESQPVVKRIDEQAATMMPNIVSGDANVRNIAWPTTWDKDWFYVADAEGEKIRKDVLVIEKADYICVNIYRGVVGLNNVVNPKAITIDTIMCVKGKYYRLSAGVYSVGNNHYAALLRSGEKWYNYDDTNTQNNIGLFAYEYAGGVRDTLEQRSNLLFYYPIEFVIPRNIQTMGGQEYGRSVGLTDMTRDVFELMVNVGELNPKNVVSLCGTNTKIRSWCDEDFYRRQSERLGLTKTENTWQAVYVKNAKAFHLWDMEKMFSYPGNIHKIVSTDSMQYLDGSFINTFESKTPFSPNSQVGLIVDGIQVDYDKWLIINDKFQLGFLKFKSNKTSFIIADTDQTVPFKSLSETGGYYNVVTDINGNNHIIQYDYIPHRIYPLDWIPIKISSILYIDKSQKYTIGLSDTRKFFIFLRSDNQIKYPLGESKLLYAGAMLYIDDEISVTPVKNLIVQKEDGNILLLKFYINTKHVFIEELFNNPVTIKKIKKKGNRGRNDTIYIIFEDGTVYAGGKNRQYEKLIEWEFLNVEDVLPNASLVDPDLDRDLVLATSRL